MKKLYLSGPITGTDDYKKRFDEASDKLCEFIDEIDLGETEIINPAHFGDIIPSDATYEQILNMCFDIIDMCDALIMLPGWEKSRGCNQEYGFAKAAGKEIFEWGRLFSAR